MAVLFQIARCNIWRNPLRTIMTISAISFSVAVILVSIAMMDGSHSAMIERMINLFSCSIQLHKAGYQEDSRIEKSFVPSPEVYRAIDSTAGVSGYSPRLQVGALSATSRNTMGAFVAGVDPVREQAVTNIADRIVQGVYFNSSDRYECLLGEKLAGDLKAEVGEEVVFIVQGLDGSTGARRFRLKGILKSGSDDIDRSMAYILLSDAQEILSADNHVSSIAIKTDSPGDIYGVVAELKRKLPGKDLEVLGWKELMPRVVQFIALDRLSVYMFLGIFFLIVIFGVMTVTLISVMERKKEFGLLMALGTGANQVVLMVILEALLLILSGTVIGVAVGLVLSIYGMNNPIPLPGAYKSITQAYGMNNMLYFSISPLRMMIAVIGMVLLSIVFSLYPAFVAVTVNPARAMNGRNRYWTEIGEYI